MRITIVTITYNNAEGLRKTLASVAAQTYRDIEHIVIDGRSNDSTADVLAAATHPVTAASFDPKGVYDAINHGLEMAGGDIIGLLHAGDVFTADDVLGRIAGAFMADDAPDFIIGDIHFENAKGRTVRYCSGKHFRPSDLNNGMMPPHPSLYMTREAVRTAGPYLPGYRVSGDFEMFVRLFLRTNLRWRYLPVDIVAMSTGGISSHWKNRLYRHNLERMRSFRDNGMSMNPLRLVFNYCNVIKSFLCLKP